MRAPVFLRSAAMKNPGPWLGRGFYQPKLKYCFGSVVAPFTRTSKWRCGPVELPVEPT